MKRGWLAVALLLSLGMNVGIVAILLVHKIRQREAPPPAAGDLVVGPGVPMDLADRMADRLRLDGETRDRFVTIQDAFLKRAVRSRRELEGLRRELRGEMIGTQPDRERSLDLVTRSAALQSDLERAFVESILDTRELLGPIEERLYLQMLARLRPLVLGGGAGGSAREGRPSLRERGGGGPLAGGLAERQGESVLDGERGFDAPAGVPAGAFPAPPGGVPLGDGQLESDPRGRPFPGARADRLAPGADPRRQRAEELRERLEARRQRRDGPPRWSPRTGPSGLPGARSPASEGRPAGPPTEAEPAPAPEAGDSPPP